MSRLYEGESLEIYDPKYGGTTSEATVDPMRDDAWMSEALEQGRVSQDLLDSAGWKLLKSRLDSEVKILSAVLLDATEPGTIARLQSAIKIYGNIEGFINRYVRSGQLALQESEMDSEG